MENALESGRVVRGLVLPILLQVAASIAKGVVPNLGSSCLDEKLMLFTRLYNIVGVF